MGWHISPYQGTHYHTIQSCTINLWTQFKNKLTSKQVKKNSTKNSYLGPYMITAVRNNGTGMTCKEKVTDTFYLQNLTPNKE